MIHTNSSPEIDVDALYNATDYALQMGPHHLGTLPPQPMAGVSELVTFDRFQGWELPDQDAGFERVIAQRFRTEMGGQGFSYQFDSPWGSQYLGVMGTLVERSRMGWPPQFRAEVAGEGMMSGLIRRRNRVPTQTLVAIAGAAIGNPESRTLGLYDIEHTTAAKWIGSALGRYRHI